MIQWGAVSFAHFFDTRMVGLSWADRGVLYHLALIASTAEDGATVLFQQRPGEALAATWTRALGEGGAASVGRLIEQGLLVLCPEGLRIVLRAERHGKAPAVGDAWVVPSSDTERPQGAVTTRGKPSASKAAQRARNDRAKFATRSAPFKDAPEGVKWDAWVATAEGRAFVELRDLEFPGYRAWVTPQGNAVGNTPGNAWVTPLGNTPPEKTSSSENSEEEKREEGEGNAVPTAQVTPLGNTPKVTPLDMLRDAAGAAASLHGNPDLERGLLDQLTRRKLTDDVLRAMGAALATPGAWWRGKGAPEYVTLTDLAGYCDHGVYAWKALDWLVAHASKRTRPASPPRTIAAPPPSLAAELEQAARFQREVAERMGKTPKDEASHG